MVRAEINSQHSNRRHGDKKLLRQTQAMREREREKLKQEEEEGGREGKKERKDICSEEKEGYRTVSMR